MYRLHWPVKSRGGARHGTGSESLLFGSQGRDCLSCQEKLIRPKIMNCLDTKSLHQRLRIAGRDTFQGIDEGRRDQWSKETGQTLIGGPHWHGLDTHRGTEPVT